MPPKCELDTGGPIRPREEKPTFYTKVYEIVEQIPKGKVTTYGAIAEIIGMKGSSRMVGQALGALPEDSDVPAQRVINRMGALSGAPVLADTSACARCCAAKALRSKAS